MDNTDATGKRIKNSPFKRTGGSESILHFVWQFRLFALQDLKTTDGQPVEVIDVGKLNTDAGPDFFNAKLKIDDTLWAGNIEIHNLSSDWIRHRHETDKAYDNVILHVVNKADTTVFRTNGEPIPQLELIVPEHIWQNYNELLAAKKWIPCQDKIGTVAAVLMSSWKNALLVERLQRKASSIETLLAQSNNHWEEAFYISLARSFGFGTNSQAFEQTAKSLPLSVLAKHKDNLFQLEALLLGQAGFLEETARDEYQESLQREYRFLRTKYRLSPIDSSQWKLLRLRPDNFPLIRLAQFASLTHRSSKLFSKILEAGNMKVLRELFVTDVSEYWKNHYLFGEESPVSKKRLGKASVDVLIINTVVPFLFTYAGQKGEDTEPALNLLEELPAEKNAIIDKWIQLGIPCENAFDSQALLQLKKNYCEEKKCLRCRVGHKVLSL